MKRTLITGAALLMLGGAANASDLYAGGSKDSPLILPAPIWSGFYLGIGPSYDGVKHNLTLDAAGRDINFAANLNGIGGDDISFLVTGGADYQFPGSHFVTGIGGDYKFANAGSSLSVSAGSTGLSAKYNATDIATAWGRLGYLVNSDTLFYFKGGYGWATFHPDGVLANIGDHTFEGGLIGAGLETRLDSWINGLTARLEYTYLGANGASLFSSRLASPLAMERIHASASWRPSRRTRSR